MKTFRYKKYRNCYFVVDSYRADNKAMYIGIENEYLGNIIDCTVYSSFGIYEKGITTIKNYSENSHMTEFLEKKGIVENIIYRNPANSFVVNTLHTKDPQTIDTCFINLDKLKEYTKEWNYNV